VATLQDLLARLDPDPYRRGKQFEHICKWFLTHDPIYAHELRQVWLWDEWPGRWGIDAGIDLVAEDHQGKLWAIQTKAYDAAYPITKHDVDTFLSESGRPEFSFRLLIATTNRIGSNAKRTIEKQEKQASVLDLGQLAAAQVDWPSSPSDLRARQRPPKRPGGRWAYQGEATEDVVNGFRQAERGQLIMACGTGKTLIALFITEKLAAERTLVLVPSLSLLAQTLREWTANSLEQFEFLPVCSDETVSDPDAAVANTSDLGFPVTTDPEEIAEFLRRRSGRRVVFATYQSSPEIAKAFRLGRVPTFDLVIADESHRCAGRVSSDFATILDAEEIKARRRLFMTATPRYFTGRVVREAQEADFEVASMDNEAAFGRVFYRLTFGEAIKRDLLTDYQVAVVGVDDATYRDWAERGRFVTTNGTEVTDARTLAGQIGLAKAMRGYDLQRTITFHSRVKRAQGFAYSLPKVIAWMPADQRPTGQLWSDYASGEMPAGQRTVLLQHLRQLDRGQRGLLANARCLAEGVDVPTLDGVAFIDPRRSEVDIVQAVGRAIRRAPDKTIGTVVIPVFIETDEDPETALDDSAFKPVWDVVKALRSHDDELAEQLDELRRQLGRTGAQPQRPGRIHLDLPARVGSDFARAFDVRLVEQATAPWEFWYGLLERFVEQHGDARVPGPYTVDNYRLGAWVIKQRAKRVEGRLDPERQQRLQVLPGWSWDPYADQWQEGFSRLKDYVERNGDARVPRSCALNGFQLGQWVKIQRGLFGNGRLEPERQRRLEELPGWTWDPRADQWEEGFSQLKDYVEEHGDARVPRSHVVNGYQLGNWVVAQRSKNAQGRLDPERQRRLEELPGWSWNTRADQWEEGFSRLRDYVEAHGDALVSASYTVDGYRLGMWIVHQRTLHGEGALEIELERRLQALPGWSWDPRADQWEDGFSRLKNYVEQHGDARVPFAYTIDGHRLGSWVTSVRSLHAKGRLEAKREYRLEELPGWSWNTLADQWEEGFSRLKNYVEQHGDARVPFAYTIDGHRLGTWVTTQRKHHAAGKLDADRECRLEELPGWSWDARAAHWEQGFRLLLHYVKEKANARVPGAFSVDGYPLGGWVATQRLFHAKGTLSADRERRLQELPGWSWDIRTDQWEEGFRHLLRYIEQNGDAFIPKSSEFDGYKLGQWAGTQRNFRAQGRLDADRERRLEQVPGWTWSSVVDIWGARFRQLLEYVERQGDARVPFSYSMDGNKLGQWVVTQRAAYSKGTLGAERASQLQQLPGWTWDPIADQWEEGFSHLMRYVERHGHARAPVSCTLDGYRLGTWVNGQRSKHNEEALDAERRRRLEELPGWTWNAIADHWEEGFCRLLKYVEHHGDARVPRSYVIDGCNLGAWVTGQRSSYTKGRLDAERQRRLEALPGWTWDPHADRWEEGFRQLSLYVGQHGDPRVPDSYSVDSFPLAQWVRRQRNFNANGRLSAERRSRLEELPGWTWDPHADRWEGGFNRLLSYVERHGDARVPRSYRDDEGYKLGGWVGEQRASYNKGAMVQPSR
jgi:superfamily II DNA or RNA helicase